MVWHPLHAEIPYSLGQIILDFLSLLSYLLGEVVWGRLKKDAFLKQRFGFLDFTQFSGKKKSLPPKQNHYLLSCSLHRAGYLQLLKLLAMAVGCVNQANAVPDEKHDALPLSIQLSVLEDCYVTMLDIAMLDVTGTPLTTERVTAMVLQAVSFDQWKRCDPLGILFYNVERKLCIAVVTAIVMTLRSLIKTEPRTAKLRQVDSHYEYQGLTGKWTSEWMNQSLVFCSLPLCHFLILSFQVVCFWEKNPSARLCMLSFHVTSQVSRYLDGSFQLPLSPETDIWKKLRPNSNVLYILLKSFRISLPINAKKNLLQHHFLQSIRTFWSSIWSSTVEVPFMFVDLCRFSRVDVPPSGPENVPKPGLPPYSITGHHFLPFRVPAKKSCGTNAMEVCALPCSLQAWLRNV